MCEGKSPLSSDGSMQRTLECGKYERVFTISIYASVPVSLALGFIAPMLVNRGSRDLRRHHLRTRKFVPKDGAEEESAPYSGHPLRRQCRVQRQKLPRLDPKSRLVSYNEGIRLLQRDLG